jgi:hypothetical protein
MEWSNAAFLGKFANYTMIPRNNSQSIINIDKNEIHSGDFLAILRLDGLDPLIMVGTGSHIGHSAVCMWIDGELYVLESQDGWYWPTHGIQRTKWDTWVGQAFNASFNVALMPLSNEMRARFNATKAMEWFTGGIEGLDYGFKNMLFSWIDTPDKNFPMFVDPELFIPLLGIADKLIPFAINLIGGEALNMRMGTRNLTYAQVVAVGARRNLTFLEMTAIVEQEGWEYSNGLQYVCSCLVVGIYKSGGMFGDLSIQSTEFIPKDIYQMNIFNHTYVRPQACVDSDPDLPYCQIMGQYKLWVTGYNSIPLYSHMNENCASQGPMYVRPDGC